MSKAIGAIVMVLWPGLAFAQTQTIAALGDSLTQGFGLPSEQGFVPRLETWLQGQGQDVKVVNAGVSGDTTAGGLSRVAWTLTPDVDGLIVALGGNDLLRGLDPEVSRANLDGILKVAQAAGVKVLLVGMQAPGNYGPDYKSAFDAIYPDLAAVYDTGYATSFFDGLGGVGTDPASLRDFMQADGIHPNEKGVERIVEGLGPHVLDLISRID